MYLQIQIRRQRHRHRQIRTASPLRTVPSGHHRAHGAHRIHHSVPPAEATLALLLVLMACALVLIQYGAANFTANYGHEAGGAQVPFPAAHVPARVPPTPPRSSIPRGDLDDLTPWQGPRRSLWLVHSRGRGCRLVSSKEQVLHVQILFLPFFLAFSRSFVLRLPSSRRPASLPATRYQAKQFAL